MSEENSKLTKQYTPQDLGWRGRMYQRLGLRQPVATSVSEGHVAAKKIMTKEENVEVTSESSLKIKAIRKTSSKKIIKAKPVLVSKRRNICKPSLDKDIEKPLSNLSDIPSKTFLVDRIMEVPVDTIKYAVFLNSEKKKSYFKLVRKATENGIDELTFKSVTYEKLEDNPKHLSQVLQVKPQVNESTTVKGFKSDPKFEENESKYFSKEFMQQTIIACPFSSEMNKTTAEVVLEQENLPDDGNATIPINNIDKLMTVIRARERYTQETYEKNQNLAYEMQDMASKINDLTQEVEYLRDQVDTLSNSGLDATATGGTSHRQTQPPPPTLYQASGSGPQPLRNYTSDPSRIPLEKRKIGERYEADKPFLPWYQTFNYSCTVDEITGREKTRWFLKHMGSEAGVRVISQLEAKFPNGFTNLDFEVLAPTILHVLGKFVGDEKVQTAQAMKLRQGINERIDEYVFKKRTALKTSCPGISQEIMGTLILSGLNDRYLQVYEAVGKSGDILTDLMATQAQIDATESIIKGSVDPRGRSWMSKFDLDQNYKKGNSNKRFDNEKSFEKTSEPVPSKDGQNQKETPQQRQQDSQDTSKSDRPTEARPQGDRRYENRQNFDRQHSNRNKTPNYDTERAAKAPNQQSNENSRKNYSMEAHSSHQSGTNDSEESTETIPKCAPHTHEFQSVRYIN